MFNRQSNREET